MRPLLVSMVALALAVPVAGAATKEVTITPNGTGLDPDTVRVAAGGSVRWTKGQGTLPHNVREDGELFRSGDATTMPIDFTVPFSAGTYHYYCEVHGSPSGGMDGLVKVPARTAGAPVGLPFTVIWATSASQTGDVYDVQYRVGGGSWQSWQADTGDRRGTFGKGGEPEAVQNGTSYSFRVRSGDGSAESRWSPKASFKA